MKKKLLGIVLAACVALSFAACGDMGNGNDSTSSETDSSSQAQVTETTTTADKSDSEEALSKLKKVKEAVGDAKEIVSDVKEIKDSLNSGKIAAPMKAKKCKGENYEKIKEAFSNAGFKDFTIKSNGKLKVGILHDEGDVEYISINGDESFGKGDKFPEDAKVVISYYSK